jgi:hypothetical protein
MFRAEGRCGHHGVRDGSNRHDDVHEDANLQDDVHRYRKDVHIDVRSCAYMFGRLEQSVILMSCPICNMSHLSIARNTRGTYQRCIP